MEFEREEDLVKAKVFGEMKKKEKKCKGNVYIGFRFCKGVANKVNERGFFANRGGEVSLSLATWPAMEEREKEGH